MLDDLRELYQEVILDHGKDPRNYRKPDNANREAMGHNPLCGDRLVVYLTIGENNVVEDIAFLGNGGAISVASASIMTEIVQGKTRMKIDELYRRFHEMCTTDCEIDFVDDQEVEKLAVLSGVRQFPVRVKCATLAWHTMDAALKGEPEISTER